MPHLLRLSIFIVITIATVHASAGTALLDGFGDLGTQISSTALSAASSTFQVKNYAAKTGGTWPIMVVYISTLDADNGVSAITMSCTGSKNQNSTDYTLQDITVSSGVGTSADASWVKDPGANTTRWPWRVDVRGFPDVECTFTDTGGDASDTITVDVSFST